MTRYTLLYSVCFISTIIVFIVNFITSFGVVNTDTAELLRLMLLLMSVDSFFNTLSVWLNLSFAKDWYSKICKQCDRNCGKFYGNTEDVVMMTKEVATTVNIDVKIETMEEMTVKSETTGNTAVIM